MDKLDIFFLLVFVIGTIITMFLIYFYNVRHKYEVKEELDDFVVEKKPGEKALYESNDNFNWDVYESDLSFNHEKFFGYDQWKTKDFAEKRIKFLKDSFIKNPTTLQVNMLESMLLIDLYGKDVILDDEGIYRVNKIYINNFLDDLTYDMKMIDRISELKDELEFSVENYEVDAKKIFYIMKKARSFGLYNFDSQSQVFLFAKKHKNVTVDGDVIIEDRKGISQMDLIIDDNDALPSNFSSSKKGETEEGQAENKDDIFLAFKHILATSKKHIDSDGNTVIEYANGQKVIRSGLWSFEALEDEEDNQKQKKDWKQKTPFEAAFEPEPIDKIMSDDMEENKNNSSQKEKEPDSKNPKKELDEEIVTLKEEKDDNNDNKRLCFKNVFLDRYKLFADDNARKDIKYFLGELSSNEECLIAFTSLSDKNIKALMILFLTVDAAKLETDSDVIDLIVELKGKYYISYEYIAMILLNMFSNWEQYARGNKILSDNNLLIRPISIVEVFLKLLKGNGVDFRVGDASSFQYFKKETGPMIGMSVVELSKDSIDLLLSYNSTDKINALNATPTTRQIFKTTDEPKKQVDFKDFITF